MFIKQMHIYFRLCLNTYISLHLGIYDKSLISFQLNEAIVIGVTYFAYNCLTVPGELLRCQPGGVYMKDIKITLK